MITPNDIENKDFSKSVNGYKREEVDNFLNLIMVDLENLIGENLRLKSQNQKLEQEVDNLRKNESTIVDTLNSAKQLMNDISASAEKRAELLIKNAETEADAITRDARDSVARLKDDAVKLQDKINRFKQGYEDLLKKELARLDDNSVDLLAEIERDFLPASLEDDFKEEEFFRGLNNSSKKTRVI